MLLIFLFIFSSFVNQLTIWFSLRLYLPIKVSICFKQDICVHLCVFYPVSGELKQSL